MRIYICDSCGRRKETHGHAVEPQYLAKRIGGHWYDICLQCLDEWNELEIETEEINEKLRARRYRPTPSAAPGSDAYPQHGQGTPPETPGQGPDARESFPPQRDARLRSFSPNWHSRGGHE